MPTMVEMTLPAAVGHLLDAVGQLANESKGWVNGRVHLAPSRYRQLVNEIAASGIGESTRRRHAGSQPPIWAAAHDLVAEIDGAVAAWSRAADMTGFGDSTPSRLRGLAERHWQVEDVGSVMQIVGHVRDWVVSADALLTPERVMTLNGAACPACGAKHFYRPDGAGSQVRRPALELVAAQGCTCQACGAHWGPELYLHLCRVLGYAMPAGVLE